MVQYIHNPLLLQCTSYPCLPLYRLPVSVYLLKSHWIHLHEIRYRRILLEGVSTFQFLLNLDSNKILSKTVFFFLSLSILLILWCFGNWLCFCLQRKSEEAPTQIESHSQSEALSKGYTILAASSHFTWRQMQRRIKTLDNMQKKKIVALSCVPCDRPLE